VLYINRYLVPLKSKFIIYGTNLLPLSKIGTSSCSDL